jgi:hypothetical protein
LIVRPKAHDSKVRQLVGALDNELVTTVSLERMNKDGSGIHIETIKMEYNYWKEQLVKNADGALQRVIVGVLGKLVESVDLIE